MEKYAKYFFISIFSLSGFSNMILSDALILPYHSFKHSK